MSVSTERMSYGRPSRWRSASAKARVLIDLYHRNQGLEETIKHRSEQAMSKKQEEETLRLRRNSLEDQLFAKRALGVFTLPSWRSLPVAAQKLYTSAAESHSQDAEFDSIKNETISAAGHSSPTGEQLYAEVISWLRQLPALTQLKSGIAKLQPLIIKLDCPEHLADIRHYAETLNPNRRKRPQHNRYNRSDSDVLQRLEQMTSSLPSDPFSMIHS
ncbi:hypothetical protein NVV93_08590 [Pseudomonas sp. LS44]|uniref:hypothetical protein n=1 Tax=Pseudomonas sp. LS44 TaxID=1357074 RepID=UPI00215B690A|nr:hypothetical protein [Pseudomonas sp. LS44]UVE19416.1 hypothetical protein NVV93_08590 [Pseudomonas sp. LS44]